MLFYNILICCCILFNELKYIKLKLEFLQNKNERIDFDRFLYLDTYLIGRKHNQLPSNSGQSFLFVRRKHPVSGREKSVKIADRSSRSEDGITAVPAYEFAHFL